MAERTDEAWEHYVKQAEGTGEGSSILETAKRAAKAEGQRKHEEGLERLRAAKDKLFGALDLTLGWKAAFKAGGKEVETQITEGINEAGRNAQGEISSAVNGMVAKVEDAKKRLHDRITERAKDIAEKTAVAAGSFVAQGLRPAAWLEDHIRNIYELPTMLYELQAAQIERGIKHIDLESAETLEEFKRTFAALYEQTEEQLQQNAELRAEAVDRQRAHLDRANKRRETADQIFGIRRAVTALTESE